MENGRSDQLIRTCWECEHVFLGGTGDYCSVYGERIISPLNAASDCPVYSPAFAEQEKP